MRKLLFGILVFTSTLNAQSSDSEKFLLTSKEKTLMVGSQDISDPYLSPLLYNGLSFAYNHDTRRYLSAKCLNISMQNKLNMYGGMALNPTKTASMVFTGVNYGWAIHRHFRPLKNLQLLLGGFCDIDFMYKMVGRNVNNPVNVDLATNLNVSGVARYDLTVWRKVLRMQLTIQSPIVGYMFVPVSGASYYEMFELWNLSGATHFSSVHNKRGLNLGLSVDFPFNKAVCRLNMGYKGLKYAANDMVFRRSELSVGIGTTFDIATFAGRKNKAPGNFFSTNE